jgi:hypothetical protein
VSFFITTHISGRFTSSSCLVEKGPVADAYCANFDEDKDEGDDWFFPFFRAMDRQCNGTDRRKPKYSEKIPSQCHFVQHKSHMD